MGEVNDIVVIAVDGSPQAEEAFNWYLTHLHKTGNYVVLAHAMELPTMPSRDTFESESRASKEKRQEVETKYTGKLQNIQVPSKFVAELEKPGEFVVETAKKEGATYIVMGTRGLGKIRRTIMGSVSDYVVHHAACPVMVCRQK